MPKHAVEHAPPANKMSKKKVMRETPPMAKPEKYEKPAKNKTRS